jgi:hypothetical protein
VTTLTRRLRRPFIALSTALVGVLAVAAPASADYIYNSWRCNTGTSSFYGATHSCIVGTVTAGTTQYGNPTADRKFALGPDHQVWNVVHYETGYLSGWRSLGGWGKSGVWVSSTSGPQNMVIHTIGSDSRTWCKRLSNGSWGAWYRC